MRYLLLSSLLIIYILFAAGCRSAYKDLQPATGNVQDLEKFRPRFRSALYNARVNVMGKYLSGLLLIKTMPDSSIRIVFSNEMGLTFFDFGFSDRGDFKVHYIIKQMDKKAVIRTLNKEFELILMKDVNESSTKVFRSGDLLYYRFKKEKGYNYYITDMNGKELIRMEKSSARKPVAEAIMRDYHNGVPDTIGISHKKFSFTIGLKRLENNAAE